MDDVFEIINEDCLKAMKGMEDNTVDAIVTDPPYGLSFMGAKWDSFNGRNGRQTTKERRDEGRRYAKENKGAPRYGNSHGKKVTRDEMVAFQQSMTPIFEEALRVSKSGTHLLCFGGTRTFHRLACSLEDAGWEIRDTIMWVYGSGFPKSMDVGKAIDKALGAERKVVGTKRNPLSKSWREREGRTDYAESMQNITLPATDQAKEWDGWGTCLKPAWEPIIVARKPLDGTVAHNVMTHGTGAINIDGCRVPTSDKLGGGMRAGGADGVWDRPFMHDEQAQAEFVERKMANVEKSETLGRFPANLVHDGSQEVRECFPDAKGQQGDVHAGKPRRTGVCYGDYPPRNAHAKRKESDTSAARFFYCAKASKSDRGEGNDHPTVKPNALMRWLVRLVCPQGGIVLDPFMGSGSTGVACVQEGMKFIGIDMDEHYCEIAEKRINNEPMTLFNEL